MHANDGIIVQDEICGNFHLTGNSPKQTIWEQRGIDRSFGTLSIYHAAGNGQIEVRVNNEFVIHVPLRQTKSLTFADLRKVEVAGDPSSGKYCIALHYFSPIHEDYE